MKPFLVAVLLLISTAAIADSSYNTETAEDIEALAPLHEQTREWVHKTCDRFNLAASHQCIADWVKGPVIAAIEALPDTDRNHIRILCHSHENGEGDGAYPHCLEEAVGVTQPVIYAPPAQFAHYDPKDDWPAWVRFLDWCAHGIFDPIGDAFSAVSTWPAWIALPVELLMLAPFIAAFVWFIDFVGRSRPHKSEETEITPPDPYFSSAAMDPLKERSAHGSGDFATATPLHSSLNSSANRGEAPKFED